MVTAFDVDSNKLIEHVADKLETELKIEKPDWINYVKSGSHAEHRPKQLNFWYLRMASILRKAYVNGKVGVNSLRDHYGGLKNRGVKPNRHASSSGAIIRRAIQSLEKHGLLKKEKVGRVLTPKAHKMLDSSAYTISKGAIDGGQKA